MGKRERKEWESRISLRKRKLPNKSRTSPRECTSVKFVNGICLAKRHDLIYKMLTVDFKIIIDQQVDTKHRIKFNS